MKKMIMKASGILEVLTFCILISIMISTSPANAEYYYNDEPWNHEYDCCDFPWPDVAYIGPTCTEPGYTVWKCFSCGQILEYLSYEGYPLGHDWEYYYGSEASCTQAGTSVYRCRRCGDEQTEEDSSPLGHDWQYISGIKADCTHGGSTVYKCSRCGAERTEEGSSPLGHDWQYIRGTQANCTQSGNAVYKCSRCGVERTDESSSPLGHDWQYVSGSANCTQAGVAVYKCSRCGEHLETRSPELGHDWVNERRDATCISGGFVGKKCRRCGVEDGNNTSALGHDWGQWKSEVNGNQTRTCKRCGYSEYKSCSHQWDNGRVTRQSTVSQEGEIIFTCKICGATKKDTIEKIKVCITHSWGEWKITVEATIDREGQKERKCKTCGKVDIQVISKLQPIRPGKGPIGIPGDDDLHLIVTINNSLSNGNALIINWTIVNSGSSPCTLQGIYYNQLNGNTTIVALDTKSSMSIAPNGGSASGTTTIYISVTDFSGSVLNICFQATVKWTDGSYGCSNHVICGVDAMINRLLEKQKSIWDFPSNVTNPEDVSVVKEELGQSSDPKGYQIGEIIKYLISVTNNASTPVDNVIISDPIADNQAAISVIGSNESLNPGEKRQFVFERTVSAEDVKRGYIANTAMVSWTDPGNQETISASSNTVVLPVTDNGNQPKLDIEKQITNASNKQPDGTYRFTFGDKIDYNIIITNKTQKTFKNVLVFDTLAVGILEKFSSIAPGEEKNVVFQYEVQQTDVDTGKLTNMAAIIFQDEDGNSIGAFTDEVDAMIEQSNGKAVTIEKPKEITDNGTIPTIAKKKQEPLVDKNNQPIPQNEMPVTLPEETEEFISCKRTLVAEGDGVAEYRIYRCAIHEKTFDALQMELNAASSSTQRIQAWDKAAKNAMMELSSVYDAIYASATSSQAKETVKNELYLYKKQIDCFKQFLQCLYADEPEIVSQFYAEAVMAKCCAMCYEVHCAPLARLDSYTATVSEPSVSGQTLSCTYRTDSSGESTRMICEEHVSVEAQIMQMVRSADSGENVTKAWKQAQTLWTMQYTNITNKFYQKNSDDAAKRDIVRTERQSFAEWLMTREQVLELLYTENPEIVAEVLAQEIQERAMWVCHYTEGMPWR